MGFRFVIAALIVVVGATLAVGATVAAGATVAVAQTKRISAIDAHAMIQDGKIDLVDIRRPREWRKTGIAVGAVTITMHQDFEKFLELMETRAAKNGGLPIAIICAVGVRTQYIQAMLARRGLDVINVADGMFGGQYHSGKGWRGAGFPIRKWRPTTSSDS